MTGGRTLGSVVGSSARGLAMLIVSAGFVVSAVTAHSATLVAQTTDPVAVAEAERDALLSRAAELRSEIEALEAEVTNPSQAADMQALEQELADAQQRLAAAEARVAMADLWLPLDVPAVFRGTVVGTYGIQVHAPRYCSDPTKCGQDWLPFDRFTVTIDPTTGDYRLVVDGRAEPIALGVDDRSAFMRIDLTDPRYTCDGVLVEEGGVMSMEFFPWVIDEDAHGAPHVRHMWGSVNVRVDATATCEEFVMRLEAWAERVP